MNKKYIAPKAFVVEIETESTLATSNPRVGVSMTKSTSNEDDFATSESRSNLWGED